MNARMILDECDRRGVTLATEGESIRLRGPAEAITKGLVECVGRNKIDLARLLKARQVERATAVMADLVHIDGPHSGQYGPPLSPCGPSMWTTPEEVFPLSVATYEEEEEEEQENGPHGPHYSLDIAPHLGELKSPSGVNSGGNGPQVSKRCNESLIAPGCGPRGPRGPSTDFPPQSLLHFAPDWLTLSGRRWGPALNDPTPGIVVDTPNRARMIAAMRALKN